VIVGDRKKEVVFEIWFAEKDKIFASEFCTRESDSIRKIADFSDKRDALITWDGNLEMLYLVECKTCRNRSQKEVQTDHKFGALSSSDEAVSAIVVSGGVSKNSLSVRRKVLTKGVVNRPEGVSNDLEW